jgi:hypothetical protein
LDYATLQKIYATPFDAKSEAARRYSPPHCTGVKIRVRAGAPRQDRISTSFVERANLTVRHFNKRFARLGLGYDRAEIQARFGLAACGLTARLSQKYEHQYGWRQAGRKRNHKSRGVPKL